METRLALQAITDSRYPAIVNIMLLLMRTDLIIIPVYSLHEQRLKGCRFIAFLLAPVLLKSLIIFVTSPTENKGAADQ